MTSKKDKSIQYADYSANFVNHLNALDSLRDGSLNRLLTIRSSRSISQKRQLKLLVSKYGEKHQKVLAQAGRIVREKEMVNYLSFAIDKADCEIDSIKGSFILHGRVVADDIKGLSGLRVQLLDPKNNVIGKPVKTDKEGFYSLVIDFDESIKSKKLNVVVLDKQGTQIHKDRRPILGEPDSVESRDIVIAGIDKLSRDINILLKAKLSSSKPKARKKASTGVKPVRKSVKKPTTRKKVNKKT